MSNNILPSWSDVHTIVFDFDGVFTNNKVWVDQEGVESVRCDRGDGLGLDLLRKFIELKNWDLNYFILSKEQSPVVGVRASKIKVKCIQNVSDKRGYLETYLRENNFDFAGLIYLGNDLNDLPAMLMSGFSIAPSDAHPLVLKHAKYILKKKGGDGCVRELIELLVGVDDFSTNEILNFFR